MSRRPKDDPTSLGNILLEWEVITEEQLDKALKEQETLRGDDLLGRLLVASGACTEEEVHTAMSAQASMRSVGRHKVALAVADLALKRQRRDSVITRADRLVQKGAIVARSIAGDGHVAVASAMLAKPSGEG